MGQRPVPSAATCGRLDLDDDFDAVVGRWILMYVDDPAEPAAATSPPTAGPGGVVAFLESANLAEPVTAYPPIAARTS